MSTDKERKAFEAWWLSGPYGFRPMDLTDVGEEEALNIWRAALASQEVQSEPLTDEQIIDAVHDAGLDWQQGWTLENGEPNRYTQLVRAIERAHGIGTEPAQAAPHRDDEALMRRAEDIIDQLCACHDEPDCPAVTLGRELQAELRIRLGIKE